MKSVFDGPRDTDGLLVLGDPNKGCGLCGAPAEAHYAANGKAVWWHSPTDCCTDRTKRVSRATARASATDYKRPDEEPRRIYE